MTQPRGVSRLPVKGWKVDARIKSESAALPRGRGRPKQDQPRATTQVWRAELSFEPDEQRRETALENAGLFVLVTSRPLSETFTARDVLQQYREQHQVETAFRWLKIFGRKMHPHHIGIRPSSP